MSTLHKAPEAERQGHSRRAGERETRGRAERDGSVAGLHEESQSVLLLEDSMERQRTLRASEQSAAQARSSRVAKPCAPKPSSADCGRVPDQPMSILYNTCAECRTCDTSSTTDGSSRLSCGRVKAASQFPQGGQTSGWRTKAMQSTVDMLGCTCTVWRRGIERTRLGGGRVAKVSRVNRKDRLRTHSFGRERAAESCGQQIREVSS